MTVQPMGPGTDVVVPQVDQFNTGLDDMTQADLSIPRLQIVNKEAMFKDSLSNNKMQALNVIILGLVKQRTLWPAQVPANTQSQPMCRSNDFQQGFVNLKQTISPFPYDRAELTQAHVQPRNDGQLVFNCADCKLKEWDTHPLGGKPYCNEVWSLPLLMDPFGSGQWLPAVLNLSKTNITPAKHYLGGFRVAETAAFTAYTTISLQLLKRGDNEYSNITFQRNGATDSSNWAEWSALGLEMRNFLTKEPRVFEDDKPAGPPVAAPVAAQPMAAQPVSQPGPVPAQTVAAPVAQPAPQETIVVQPAPEPAPVAQAAPVAQNDPWVQQTEAVQPPDPAPVQPPVPMQAPAAMVQEPAPQAAPPATAPAPVAPPAPAPVPAAVAPPAAAPVAPAPVAPPAPAAVPTPAPAPVPAPAAAVPPTPQPAPPQAVPTPVTTASAPVPTSPAVPQASVPAAPGPDNDDLPF